MTLGARYFITIFTKVSLAGGVACLLVYLLTNIPVNRLWLGFFLFVILGLVAGTLGWISWAIGEKGNKYR